MDAPSISLYALLDAPQGQPGDFMMERGVIPRKIGAYGLPQMLRVSIGTKEEMEICLQTIKDFVNQ